MGNAIRFVYNVDGAVAPATIRRTVVPALLRRTNGIR